MKVSERKVAFSKISKSSQEITFLESNFSKIVGITCKFIIKLVHCGSFLLKYLDIFIEVFFETPVKNCF